MIKQKECRFCKTTDLREDLLPESNQNYSKVWCNECNKWLGFGTYPKNADKNIRKNNNKFKDMHREKNGQFVCTWCGADEIVWSDNLWWTFQLDHIQQLSEGGADEYENTQILCFVCHGDKTARRKEIKMFRERLNKEGS